MYKSNKYIIGSVELFLSTILWANDCPKWYPMSGLDGLTIVLPIYNASIVEADLDCDEIIDILDEDIDGDGISNEEELATGTDPRNAASLSQPFIITVNTDVTLFHSDTEFEIPTTGSGYNYNVDCNSDGVYETIGETENYTCTYDTVGIYKITIQDNSHEGTGFPRIYFLSSGFKANELLSINQWGTGKWSSMVSAFAYCTNLDDSHGTPTDVPNLTNMTDMAYMFDGAEKFNYDISKWDVSTITRMDSTFRGADTFNQKIGTWDTSSVTSMRGMFHGAIAFNQYIGDWDVSNVKYMPSIFSGATAFNQDIGDWNTSAVRQMNSMFHTATAFNQDISSWDTSSVREMNAMFYDASAFSNHDLRSWNVKDVERHQDFMYNAGTNNIEPLWPYQ